MRNKRRVEILSNFSHYTYIDMKLHFGPVDVYLHKAANRRGMTRTSFKADFMKFKTLSETSENLRFAVLWEDKYPCLDDKTSNTGFDSHYIYHPAWAARILASIMPDYHIDISSTLTFSTMLSAFMPVKFYDYRPPILQLNNLQCDFIDLNALPFETNSVDTLSCMHTVEHIGLGRYGDKLDPEGDLKAIKELKRVVRPGGSLLFVVPVGQPKLMFNAHRIYGYSQIIDYFSGFNLKDFSLVTDKNEFIGNAPIELANSQKYGCGCFWLVKE
jgi:SAM-dependent methyltransferase